MFDLPPVPHLVDSSGQLCETCMVSTGIWQDAVTCQLCGRRVCGTLTVWLEARGNVCNVCRPERLATQYRLDELDYRVAGNMIAEAWSLAADASLIGAAVDYARRRVAASN